MLVFDLSEERLHELGCNKDFIEKLLAHIKIQYSDNRRGCPPDEVQE